MIVSPSPPRLSNVDVFITPASLPPLPLPIYQGLEEASRLYFGESNVEGMLNTLLPLHEMMDKSGPTTLKDIAFVQSYGR